MNTRRARTRDRLVATVALILFSIGMVARAELPPGLQPPRGIAVPTGVRLELQSQADVLGRKVDALRHSTDPQTKACWPDVAIFHKAVDWALRYEEFHTTNQFGMASNLLVLGHRRADQLQAGTAPWTRETGLVVRGFVSLIDDSVQPYGMVIPADWVPGTALRLDVWLAGRDEQRTELKFLSERLRSRGEFAPSKTLVLHPYGRYCNAYKFAGERDVFEAVAHAEKAYGTNPTRRALRGFSMGGAGTWHLAAHYPMFWRAAAPGAGFVDTPQYTGILTAITNTTRPPPWEQTLWRLYDVPGYAANFHQLDVVAYSGEKDRQRLAADTMAKAFNGVGLQLTHVIGPGVEHRYEPNAKREVAERVDALMASPKDPAPTTLRFTTYTTKYPAPIGSSWLQIRRLGRHWEEASVNAQVLANNALSIQLTNIEAFELRQVPGLNAGPWTVQINGTSLPVKPNNHDLQRGSVFFKQVRNRWRIDKGPPAKGKRPNSQGPIDDAFMERFLVVRPTGQASSPESAQWCNDGLEQFRKDWRGQFRGEVRIKNDVEVTPTDIAESHLILWGDPSSNRLLRKMQRGLPITWGRRVLRAGRIEVPARGHIPIFIYPNPLNPDKYVVINSGHTFARWKATNARQTPWLPDWSLQAIRPGHAPGGIIAAGFFDEDWKLP